MNCARNLQARRSPSSRVDFDKQKAFLRAHRIPRQSTVLVFKGRKEIARSIAQTDRNRLRAVVLGAL